MDEGDAECKATRLACVCPIINVFPFPPSFLVSFSIAFGLVMIFIFFFFSILDESSERFVSEEEGGLGMGRFKA